jgi:hypothetical protein
VLLTVFLIQKGSSESKKPGEPNPEDEPPHRHRDDSEAPWPVHRGGLILKLYASAVRGAVVPAGAVVAGAVARAAQRSWPRPAAPSPTGSH